MTTVDIDFEALERLNKDLKQAARLMGYREARALVDLYYDIQGFRIRSKSKITANEKAENSEPNKLLDWVFGNTEKLENDIKRALGEFAAEYTIGQWMQSICGIGPVISAGLLAHLDIRVANTAAKYWAFAGLDPTKKWEKGQKRPWNAKLKTLVAFKLGECFVKVGNNPKDFYGKIYQQRKILEIANNERGQFKEQAEQVLERKKIGKDTEAYKYYKDGKLPPAHLHARARRYACKIFLSHLHYVSHLDFYGVVPPVPFLSTPAAINSGHLHFISPPHWPMKVQGKSLKDMYSK